MNIEQAIIEKLRTLPPDKQQQVLDFAELVTAKEHPQASSPQLQGTLG